MKAQALATIVLAAAGLTLAGCAATGAAQSNTAPVIQVGASNSPHIPPSVDPVRQTTATDTDNGRTITVAVGDQLKITLHSTYWHFGAAPSGTALRPAGQPATEGTPAGPNNHCVPGEGCGTVTAGFDATTPGTAVVTATRTSCGEAMACTGRSGSYRLTVVVR
ncbi:MAG TPA: hypothetical protein VGD84_10560 [Pseudonocardiaceae bacterium]